MKFIVSRTSLWDDEKKPCDNAILEVVTHKKRRDKWKEWTIEINSLKELLDFKEKMNNPIILLNTPYKEYPYEIEIYDYFRE